VLDVDEDFYGHRVGVDLITRLRGQERYDGLDALVAAIKDDVARTRAVLEA
jgi:riboflavin kinase/FMN adenylyltransferase